MRSYDPHQQQATDDDSEGTHHGWPEIEIRQERLAEAVQFIRMLWHEGQHSHRGKYFTVENARIYSRPDEPPPIMIAAAGPKSVKLAAELGDGLIATEPIAN